MRVTFGECVFDRSRRQLMRQGSPVHAGRKLLLLLELLLDAAPRAVTKDEIHKSLWPGTFVSEATLTSLVAELRHAIGDDARAPRLVRTIHGYGYGFVGEFAAEAPAARDDHDRRSFRIILGDREIALTRGAHILGRAQDAAVYVDDTGASRQHARITIDGQGATIVDLGSKNGTIVNGKPIDGSATLADGSLIVLGATAMRFRIFEASSTTETVKRDRAKG
jgi:DNA-binding winged helix-turn-helix (wHTH) protein